MTTSFINLSNDERIHYFEIGHENINKKPTLFFIHGNFSSWVWWADTINVLKHFDYHIIAVDQRGFGESTYKNRCAYFGDWAKDLVEFCKIKNIKECTAIGWSFGGTVSMKFAEIAPELVTKVILTCSVAYEGIYFFTGQKPCQTLEELEQNPKIKSMQSLLQSQNRESVTQVFQTVLFTHTKDYPIEKRDQMITGSLKQRCYLDVMLALANTDININAIKAKGLMIHGKEDRVVLPDNSIKKTGEYFKNFEMWENHAHMIPIEDIQRYADAVRNFVQKN